MIQPLGDKVFVEVVDAESMSKGGIIIADIAKEEKAEGHIRAVGTGKLLESGKVLPIRLSVGQRVMFGKFSGDPVTVDGKAYRILKESEILAVITPDDKGESNA